MLTFSNVAEVWTRDFWSQDIPIHHYIIWKGQTIYTYFDKVYILNFLSWWRKTKRLSMKRKESDDAKRKIKKEEK